MLQHYQMLSKKVYKLIHNSRIIIYNSDTKEQKLNLLLVHLFFGRQRKRIFIELNILTTNNIFLPILKLGTIR